MGTTNGNPNFLTTPFAVPTTQLKNIVFASASNTWSVFIDRSGNVYGAGTNAYNIFSQLSSPQFCTTPCLVGNTLLKNVTIACATSNHIVYLTAKGSVYTVGGNDKGEIGRYVYHLIILGEPSQLVVDCMKFQRKEFRFLVMIDLLIFLQKIINYMLQV